MIWLYALEIFLISMLGYVLYKNTSSISGSLVALHAHAYTTSRSYLFDRLLVTLLASGLGRHQADHWWKQNWNIFRVLFVLSIPLCALTKFFTILLVPWMYAFYKYYTLIRNVRLRKYQILKRIPFVLDMLILNLQSGLDFVSSLEELVGMHDAHPLHDEIRITLQSIHVGETRTQAFQNLGTRTQVVELSHLASVIRQSETMGTSLIELLKLLSLIHI